MYVHVYVEESPDELHRPEFNPGFITHTSVALRKLPNLS